MSSVGGVSPSQVRRLFARYLRTTPRRWLTRERLIHAQTLIVQDRYVLAEVAERCGFCDVYHFSREFKRIDRRTAGRMAAQRNRRDKTSEDADREPLNSDRSTSPGTRPTVQHGPAVSPGPDQETRSAVP